MVGGQAGSGPSRCVRVVGSPDVDEVKQGSRGLGRHEPEDLLQQRVDDGMQAVVLERVPVVLGLPHIDVAQSGPMPFFMRA